MGEKTMIANLKPYPEYIESRLPWLGMVPKHWETRRSKYLFLETDKRSTTGTETRLSMSQKHGLIPSSKIDEQPLVAESNVGGKICELGDLVLNRLKAHLGVLALSPMHGLVSPDYTVFRPIGNVSSQYFCFLYRSPYCGQELRRRAKGIVEGFWRLYTDDFYDILVPVPPISEQAAIVKFLNWSNHRLDRAIKAKHKIIALLTEQKQAIIHRAVTKGNDPKVKMKASGIPLFGEIPDHWVVKPLKHFVKINDRTLGETTDPAYEFRYIDIGCVQTGKLVKDPETIRFSKAPSRARRVLSAGDTIISTVRTYLKAVWFVGKDAQNLIASTGFAVCSPNSDLDPEYLHYILQDASFVDQVTANSIGIAYPAIAESVLARLRIVVPLSKAEQLDLKVIIKTQIEPLASAISRLEREILLLREYRTRLVADVVTGKLDVREAAAKLPDEPLPETLENIDELAEDIVSSDEEIAA